MKDVSVPSVQLELDLGDRWLSIPWGGSSPRALTRAAERFKFCRGQGDMSGPTHPGQYDLFIPEVEGPLVYQGAPCLFTLPRKENDNG